MTPRKHIESGFTLIELLLAITLMAILMALAYGGLRASTRAAAIGQKQLEESGRVRVTHQFIRKQLNQMQPLPFDLLGDLPEDRVVFEGTSDHIRFVSPMPGYLGRGGPQVQILQLVRGENGQDLIFNHQLLQGYDPTYEGDSEPIVLMEGLEGAAFSFLERDENGEIAAWVDSWSMVSILPAAVTLEVTFKEEQRAIWPLLSTGVRIDEIATTVSGGSRSYADAIRDMINRPEERRQ